MATDSRSLPSFFSNSTDFQTWVSGLIAQLTAAGMVQTADTGQINGATVALPGTVNTSAGYAIFRFSDSLQATLPLYLKVEFGVGGAVDRPALWLTAGTGTNGAGTVNGQVGTRKQMSAGSTTAGSTAVSYCCYDTTGGLALSTNNNGVLQGPLAAVVDRSRDGAGAATADGLMTWYGSNLNGGQGQAIPAAPTAVPAGGTSGFAVTPDRAGGTVSPIGTNVLIVPVMWGLGRLFLVKALHLARSADVAPGTPVTVNTLGGTHTYMPLTMSPSPGDGTNNHVGLFLWE